jgi:hypothetical protein
VPALEARTASARVAPRTAADTLLAQLHQLLATPPAESLLVSGVAADGPDDFRRAVE